MTAGLWSGVATVLAQRGGDGFVMLGPCVFIPCVGILGVGLLVFWIWMIVEVATKEPSEGNDKLIWLLVVILAGWIGALIYFLARRPTRIRTYGR